MSEVIDALKTKLRDLPSRDRAELARFLIDSLGPEDDGTDAEAAWTAELARRAAEIRSGRVVGKPADQMFADLRARFP